MLGRDPFETVLRDDIDIESIGNFSAVNKRNRALMRLM